MTQQTVASRTNSVLAGTRSVAPEFAVRFTGALLAVAIAAVHVADQGGITVMASPAWIGWGYRLVEAGGILTALILLLPMPARLAPIRIGPARLGPGWFGPASLGWAAGVLLGTGPFIGYIASRTVGVPCDPGDIGNWGYWVGTVSLLVEAALILLSAGMLLAARQHALGGGYASAKRLRR
jgi:hypothetical protein